MIIKIAPNVPLESSLSSNLILALGTLNKAVPLDSFLMKYIPGQEHYTYEFKAVDNRHWKQIVRLVERDYVMSFDIPDEFSAKESLPSVDLIDLCVRLVRDHSITEIDVKF